MNLFLFVYLQQRSALSHYEETPQPIVELISGTTTPTLPQYMTPPPYNTVASRTNEKPPSYDEVLASDNYIAMFHPAAT